MRFGSRCWRWPLLAGISAFGALGVSACEPLDLALFPAPDAGTEPQTQPETPIIEIPQAPQQSPSEAPSAPLVDAGSDAAPPPEPPAPCLPGALACEACVQAAACSGANVCHPATGECVRPCADGPPQCPGSLFCSPLDVCVECTSDAQCTRDDDEPRCDVQRGVCVECLTNVDCTDDPFERPACLPNGECGCRSDADCFGGAICELDEAHCEIEDD